MIENTIKRFEEYKFQPKRVVYYPYRFIVYKDKYNNIVTKLKFNEFYNSKEFTATCVPEDEYKSDIGAAICIAKSMGLTSSHISKLIDIKKDYIRSLTLYPQFNEEAILRDVLKNEIIRKGYSPVNTTGEGFWADINEDIKNCMKIYIKEDK